MHEDIAKMFDLSGKVAIVTGAGRGIGSAIALAYAKAGASVAVASRNETELVEIVEEVTSFGGKAIAVPTDAADVKDLQNLVAKTVEQFGGVDILVNNAGKGHLYKPLLEIEDAELDAVLKLNLFGYIKLAQLCVPYMKQRGGGKIINVSSINGARPGRGLGAYNLSKSGVNSLTRILAMELGASNIQVNAIAPGVIRTKMTTGMFENEKFMNRLLTITPAKRVGETKDLIGTALLLASPAGDFMSGEILTVDGGVMIQGLG
jgi:NAD(P)-dependent dehydrogenase (short-subunit alcohol dehydrogenase family)